MALKIGNKLDSLIPQKIERGDYIKQIEISKIKPNKDQPRKHFDSSTIASLAKSISEFGLLQPVVVVSKGNEYELIAGERRFRAVKELGHEKIDAIIKDVNSETSAKLALIENIQREDLNALDEANAYQYLKDEYKITQEKLSEIVGKSRTHIANYLRLLTLDDYIKAALRENKLSTAHARTLLSEKDSNRRKILFNRVIEEEISVRELENIVSEGLGKNKTRKKTKLNSSKLGSEDVSTEQIIKKKIESELENYLGTRVKIIETTEKSGKIVIEYFTIDDFERIREHLTKK